MTGREIDKLLEGIRTGETDTLVDSCGALLRMWQGVPVDELLSLKEQFRKMNMEHREAHVEELLVSIAEKRPGPFTSIATVPDHPLWRPAIEVLSLLEDSDYLDLFISLIPLCPRKNLGELVKAIGCYRCGKSSQALSRLLSDSDEAVFLETLLALKRCGGPDAVPPLREALEKKRTEGSEMVSVIEAVIEEMGAGSEEGPHRLQEI